jgi:hypothetical protein
MGYGTVEYALTEDVKTLSNVIDGLKGRGFIHREKQWGNRFWKRLLSINALFQRQNA